MKKINLIFGFCFFISITQAQKLEWINFYWEGDSIGNKYFDKSAIFVPVEIENLPYKFSAQLDLGAIETMVYGNSFTPVLNAHPQILNKIDSSAVVWIQSTKNPTIKNLDLKLGHVSFGKRNIALFKNFGDSLSVDSLQTNSVKHIGTIGPDLFQNKVLIIDYPGKRFVVVDDIPPLYLNAKFQPMRIDNGRIKIIVSISDSIYYVMFDTGSSIFDLVTDEENIKHCIAANSPVVDSLQVSSWGVLHYLYGRRINNLKVGEKLFPDAKVYESKGDDWVRFHKSENIIGETGNALFLQSVVIIDYKNHRFGVQ